MKPSIRPQFFRTNRLFIAATLSLLAPLAQADTFTWTQNSGSHPDVDHTSQLGLKQRLCQRRCQRAKVLFGHHHRPDKRHQQHHR
jgi:hypothetical protein